MKLRSSWKSLCNSFPSLNTILNHSDESHVLFDCPRFLLYSFLEVSQISLFNHLIAIPPYIGKFIIQNFYLLLPSDINSRTNSLYLFFDLFWPFGFVLFESNISPFANLWIRTWNLFRNLCPL